MKRNNRIEKRDLDELADILKSVAHPERLAILHMICGYDGASLIVKNIYNALHLDQSTASRHLGIMKKAGLLNREVKKGKTYYGFNMDNNIALCLKRIFTNQVIA